MIVYKTFDFDLNDKDLKISFKNSFKKFSRNHYFILTYKQLQLIFRFLYVTVTVTKMWHRFSRPYR